MAGVSRQQYKTYAKYIRIMCSGRVDIGFVLRALSKGADGVFIGGCHLNDCHYNTGGNYHAVNMVLLVKKILGHIGLNPERLRLESVSAGEGMHFAEIANEFGTAVKDMGPLGKAEGLDKNVLKLKLKAVSQLVPYIRVVLNERLGVKFSTVEEYNEFYASEELDRLFRELIADKLAMTQIMLLQRESSLSTAEISKVLGIVPSETARHLTVSVKHGLRTETMNNSVVEEIIDKYQGQARFLIQILMELQEENRWLPREVLKTVSERLGVSLRQVLRIATMYKTFSLVPKGRHEIHLCTGNACHVRGAERLLAEVQNLTGLKPGETDSDSKFSLDIGCCRGNCCSGPVMEIGGKTLDKMSPAEALKKCE